MIFTRRRLLQSTGLVLASPIISRTAIVPACGQPWPARHVQLVVPFTAGGGTDSVARIVGQKLSELWRQQVVVENKGGAGTNLGTEAVARANPDGYTLLMASLPHAVNQYLYRSIAYDPVADFAPVSLLCTYPDIMVVPNSSPARSAQEFIAYAKANPGKLNYASTGIGSSTHLCAELFKRITGVDLVHVPYRGTGPATADLIPGRIDVMFGTITGLLPLVNSGQVRGLAVTTRRRSPSAPQLPTMAESGLGDFDVSAWFALLAPARTPSEILQKINTDTVAALSDATVKRKLEQLGAIVIGSTATELSSHLASETEKWGSIIREAKIRID